MAIERIESASDPRLIAYHGLRDPELLRARHLFVAEGRLVVRRVIEDSRYRVESILVNEAALNDLEQTVASLSVRRAGLGLRGRCARQRRRLRRAPGMPGARAPAAVDAG